MMFVTKAFDKQKDFKLIEGWYKQRKFQAPIAMYLPPTGVICEFEKTPTCCGFLYKTDAGVAVIGNLVSNPDVEKEIRQKGVEYLITLLILMAKASGFGMINCATNLTGLMKRFEDLNFVKTDENVSHFTLL